MSVSPWLAAAALAAAVTTAAGAASAQPPCGLSPSDWCPGPAGDRCARHRNVAECRADPACVGLAYRGESVVPCIAGERGFSPNCPTVGCRSRNGGG